MNSTRRTSSSLTAACLTGALLSSAALTGCGLFKVSTNFGGVSSGSGAPAEANYDEGAAKTAVGETYKKWSFESCKDLDCVGRFRAAAGISQYTDKGTYVYYFNPRRVMENPDKTWLVGWDKLTSDEHANEADKVYEALVLAAGSRTWLDRCHTDFDAIQKDADSAYEKTKTAIGKAKGLTDVYARIGALLDLRASVKKANARDYIETYENRVGSLYDVDVALKAAFEESGRDYLYAIDDMGERDDKGLRPRDTPEKERDHYCLRAYERGTSKTPSPTQKPSSSYFSDAGAAVKPVFADDDAKALEKGTEDAEKAALTSFKPGDFKKVDFRTVALGKGEIAGHPKLGYFDRDKLPITKLKHEGKTWTLELTRHDDGTFPYGCVNTNRVERILDDGTLEYEQICKDGKETWDVAITVTIDDLPEGVTLEVGDEISFFGLVESSTDKTEDHGPALRTHKETGALKLEHLVSLRHKGKTVGTWFRD